MTYYFKITINIYLDTKIYHEGQQPAEQWNFISCATPNNKQDESYLLPPRGLSVWIAPPFFSLFWTWVSLGFDRVSSDDNLLSW